MKIKYDFAIREILGEYIFVPLGEGALALSGMGTTNEVGAFICGRLKENRSYDELYADLLSEFEVDADVARKDLDEFLDKLKQMGFLQED